MQKRDWKIIGITVLLSMLMIMICCMLYYQNRLRSLTENELEKINHSLCEYIECETSNIENVLSSFYLPHIDEVVESGEKNVSKFLKEWVEGTKGVVSAYLITKDKDVFSYSVYDDEYENINKISRCNFDCVKYYDHVLVRSDYIGNKPRLLFSKSLFNDNNEFAGIVCFEYDTTVINKLFRKVSTYPMIIGIKAEDAYGNSIYESTNVTKAKAEVPKDTVNIFDVKPDEDVATNVVSSLLSGKKNLFSMTPDEVFNRYKTSYLEKSISANSNFVIKNGVARTTGIKIETFTLFNDASFDFATRQILPLIALMILLFIYAIWAVSVKKIEKRKYIYLFMYASMMIVFIISFINETIALNNIYDKYLDVEAYIVKQTISNARKDNENFGGLAIKMIPAMCDVIKVVNHKETSEYLLEEHLEHDEIKNFLYIIKNNFTNIKNITIFKKEDLLLSCPEERVVNQTLKEAIKNGKGISTSHTTSIDNDDEYSLLYPLIIDNKPTNYIFALTMQNERYQTLVDSKNILAGRYEAKGNLIINKNGETPIGGKYNFEGIDKTIDKIMIKKVNEKGKMIGIVASYDSLSDDPHIVALKIYNIYPSMLAAFLIASCFVTIIAGLAYGLYLRTERRKREDEMDITGENRAIERLVKKIEHDIVMANETFGMSQDDDDDYR